MKRLAYSLTVLSAFSIFQPVLASSIPDVDIVVSRYTGVAPLAVHFDASSVNLGGEILDPIHDLQFEWQFADDSDDIWFTNQHSKNTATGFVTAHLFEEPGNYDVTVRISSTHNLFEPQVHMVGVDVQDPDEMYPGEATICFSMAWNFDGCPAGAKQVTLSKDASAIQSMLNEGHFQGETLKDYRVWNIYKERVQGVAHADSFEYVDYSESWSCESEASLLSDQLISAQQIAVHAEGAKRLLFARNETFHLYDTLRLDEANGSSLGAFGECELTAQGLCANAPVFSFVAKAAQTDVLVIDDNVEGLPKHTDIRISDINFTRQCGFKNRAINLYDNVDDVVFNRLHVSELDSAIVGRTYGQEAPHDAIGMFNSELTKLGPGSGEPLDTEQCKFPDLPSLEYENGTTITEADWNTEWAAYKTAVAQIKEDQNCRGGGYNIAYMPAHRHMWMGNHMHDAVTKQGEHILRVPLAHKSVFSHNIFDHPAENKHTLKLHNMGDCALDDDPEECQTNPVQSADNYPTSWSLISDNLFKADTDIVVNIGPGTSKVGERLNNILFEGNRIEARDGRNQVALNVSSYDSTVRNNAFIQAFPEGGDRVNWAAVVVGKARNEPDHSKNNHVINNTAYVNGDASFVRLYEESDGARIVGNSICAMEAPEFVDDHHGANAHYEADNVWRCANPLVHLRFEDESDLSMDSQNHALGQVNGAPQSVSGALGNGVSFDQVGEEIVLDDPLDFVESTGEFTIMTWLNIADLSTRGEVFGRPRTTQNQGDVSLNFTQSGEAIIYINSEHIIPGIQLAEDQWHQFALTFNRADKQAKVYVDGEQVHTHQFSDATPFKFDTQQDFNLGVGQWRSGSKHFSGMLDEFRIFSDALAPETIAQQYMIEDVYH